MITLERVVLVESDGIKTKDLKLAEAILEENKELAINEWNKCFGNN